MTDLQKIINDYVIKLTGKVSILQPLEISHNYKIIIDGTITNENLCDNHDGTYDKVYKFEPILAEILKDNGEVIKAKDTRSKSQILRSVLRKIWLNKQIDMESEDFYNRVMDFIIINADEIVLKVLKELKYVSN